MAAVSTTNAEPAPPSSGTNPAIARGATQREVMVAESGLGKLTKMLNDHMEQMEVKEKEVDDYISKFSNSTLMKDAKVKSVETEKRILKSIMDDVMEMTEFLNNIVLIENKFNAIYKPYKKSQEEARAKYGVDIEKYEKKPKVNSECDSFVELMFGAQTVHIGSFQKWLNKVTDKCKESGIQIVKASGSHCKRIERAFYKAFYVYPDFKEMTDVIRCSLVFDDFDHLYRAYAVIKDLAEGDLEGGILRLKDRFNPKEMPFGYRDLLINVYCPGCKIVCELQLHHVLFYNIKKVSHRMYVKARLFEREGYNEAYRYADEYVRPRVKDRCYQIQHDDLEKQESLRSGGGGGGDSKEEEEEEVDFRKLLKEWKLDKYADKMEDEGWEDPVDWKDLTPDDLKDDIGFSKGHIKKFQRKYKEWQTAQEEKAKEKENQTSNAQKAKVDEEQNALLEAQKKQMMEMMAESRRLQEEQAKALAEQQRKYKEELEKLKTSTSINQWETKAFEFQSPLDTNGIVYGLGTEWNQLEWQNPATAGKVKVTCSGIKSDSSPMSAVCGREAVRCLTAELEDAWICLDFQDLRICPTHYWLRHYISWNIEALRSWDLEGSVNGTDWTLIKKHSNDTTMKNKGAAFAWPLNSQYYFRMFRIRMTGKNDNGHWYLCCSGFDIYGTVKRGSAIQGLPAPLPTPKPQDEVVPERDFDLSHGKVFKYKSDFDSNGIIHWLGTNKGTASWMNPVDRGLAIVDGTKKVNNGLDYKAVLGKQAVRCATDAVQRAYIMINLKDVYVKPTKYTLRHYISWDTEALRMWELHGSNGTHPGSQPEWIILKKHKDDKSLKKKGATKTWAIPMVSTDEAFNKFRIVITGKNSNDHWYLACSGFEIYGQVVDKVPQDICPPKPVGMGTAMSFEYEHDFDENGLLYYLGTYGGTKNWTNPGVAGIIGVSASSLGPNSQRIGNFVGRTAVRCLTKDEKNADMTLNLKEVRMNVTKYTLRHYSSWDIEALRDWNLEGSVDGRHWVILKSHIGDTSLKGKGCSKTWDVSHSGWFQYFRIILTGPNDNNHDYLCCSGIELYGAAVGGFVSNPPVYVKKGDPDAPHKEFKYAGHEFDECGLLYFMGTMGRTQKWTNPHSIGLCAVSGSPLVDNSESIINFCGRSSLRLVCKEAPDSDMTINLMEIRLKPSHYTLRHYSSWDTEALRYWNFEASHDGLSWIVLKSHSNDTSLNKKGMAFTWRVDCSEFYQYFRIKMTGKNSNNHDYLACSGIEFYGTAGGGIVSNPIKLAPPPQGPFRQFVYQTDFDDNGILHWLGTKGGSQQWSNPATMTPPLVAVSSSEVMGNSKPISAICGKELVRCVTKEKENSWILVDFKGAKVRLSHYSLKHYASWNIEALRNWKIEGKNPDGKWRLIAEYTNNASLKGKGGTATFKVETKEFFQQISVMMTGKNDNNHWMLACSGIEFYGVLSGGLVNQQNANIDANTVLKDYPVGDDHDDDEKGVEPGQAVRPLGRSVMRCMGSDMTIETVRNGHKVTAQSNFPSVRLNANIKGGKWYYEVHLTTDGCMQIGWADSGFAPDEPKGSGVGDEANSWAYDGWRQKKWNGGNSVRYGGAAKWRRGDVVGCCVDVEGGSIKFLLNGQDLGVAYSGLKFKNNTIFAAGTFQGGNNKQGGVFVFDESQLRQSIPVGYDVINSSFYFKPATTWKSRMCGATPGGGGSTYTETEYQYMTPSSVPLVGIAFGDNRYFGDLSVVIRRVYFKKNETSNTDECVNYEAGKPPHGVSNIKRKSMSLNADEFCNKIDVFSGKGDTEVDAVRGLVFYSNTGRETKVGSQDAKWTKDTVTPPSTQYALCGFNGTHHSALKNIQFTFVEM